MRVRVRVRKVFVIASVCVLFYGAGCQSADLKRYEYAADIRRDAKVVLSTRPADLEPLAAEAAGK